jgi:hypothetical protein
MTDEEDPYFIQSDGPHLWFKHEGIVQIKLR